MFISVPQWWQMLNDIGDDNGWSIPLRVRFLARIRAQADWTTATRSMTATGHWSHRS
jgi:hypothetical protein